MNRLKMTEIGALQDVRMSEISPHKTRVAILLSSVAFYPGGSTSNTCVSAVVLRCSRPDSVAFRPQNPEVYKSPANTWRRAPLTATYPPTKAMGDSFVWSRHTRRWTLTCELRKTDPLALVSCHGTVNITELELFPLASILRLLHRHVTASHGGKQCVIKTGLMHTADFCMKCR